MPSEIPLYWAVATGRAAVKFRRYIGELDAGPCSSAYGYHNASTIVGEVKVEITEEAAHRYRYSRAVDVPAAPPDDDPRWPIACACGYVFPARAERQVRWDELYAGAPDGVERPLMDLPAGAAWRAWWYEEQATWAVLGEPTPMFRIGPDGFCISVRTPGGEWCIDQRSSQGGYWTRGPVPADLAPGVPLPMLTCTPSILQPRYHGWLRNGVLVEC